MNSQDIRQTFIEFFDERRHLIVPSSSLVPNNDPTVLLTTAGMQQMTPYFLGLEAPPAPRMTSIQKCFRTVDIDEVGDESHLTFFEMLGNFSVGDYFKDDAIRWAWDLLTRDFGIPAERLWVTVHTTDEYSLAFWRDRIGIPEERIRRLGDEDNWWGPVSSTGSNGPDSEIHYDRGEQFGCGRSDCGPGCDHCGRFLELWNLVFTEFYKETDGSQRPLPKKNIDTGMGLERLTMILQGVQSVYDTDLYQPLIERAAELAGMRYGDDPAADRSMRIIADHARAVTFLIGDRVFPSNEGRGYILRRVLRRAVRHGRLLGVEKPFLGEIASIVQKMYAPYYPELLTESDRIQQVIAHETERFNRTIAQGIGRFETLAGELQRRETKVVPGEAAFRLYDTYGFPYELTEELASEAGFSIDRAGFDEAMEAQRQQSSSAAGIFTDADRGRAEIYAAIAVMPTTFLGYEQLESEATITHLLGAESETDEIDAGEEAEIVLHQTPFYAESGGQIGDTGTIRSATGVFEVRDTQRPAAGVIVHRGIVREGFLKIGQTVEAEVDGQRRANIRRNHTATHLLHASLRQVLGDHVHQAGSLVAPDRLRFDFTAVEPISPEQRRRIQRIVNDAILRDFAVSTTVMPYSEALSTGAMALFGEKYGDTVRVVSVDGFSKELCGGTHVGRTGDIGLFLIQQEASVASGVRRIDAQTGRASMEYASALHEDGGRLAHALHVPIATIPEQVEQLQSRLRLQEQEIEQLRLRHAAAQVDGLVNDAIERNGAAIVVGRIDAETRDLLAQIGDRVRDRIGSGAIVLGAIVDERPALLAMVTSDLVKRGLNAGTIIREATPAISGRGGGRPEMAQGGGTDPSGLEAALELSRQSIDRQLASG